MFLNAERLYQKFVLLYYTLISHKGYQWHGRVNVTLMINLPFACLHFAWPISNFERLVNKLQCGFDEISCLIIFKTLGQLSWYGMFLSTFYSWGKCSLNFHFNFTLSYLKHRAYHYSYLTLHILTSIDNKKWYACWKVDVSNFDYIQDLIIIIILTDH